MAKKKKTLNKLNPFWMIRSIEMILRLCRQLFGKIRKVENMINDLSSSMWISLDAAIPPDNDFYLIWMPGGLSFTSSAFSFVIEAFWDGKEWKVLKHDLFNQEFKIDSLFIQYWAYKVSP